jgi:hypothetical protein
MKKLSAVDKLRAIESEHAVEKISYEGIPLWPIFRVYIGAQLIFNQDRLVRPNKENISKGVMYFFRGFKNLFHSYNYISFSTSGQRKAIKDKLYERTDFIHEKFGKGLIVETPTPSHESQKKYIKPVASHMFLYGVEFFLTKLISLKKSRYEGLEIIESIVSENNVELDIKYLTRRFKAQYKTIKFLNYFWNAKFVLMTTPYTRYGYVYYLKNKKIPVIEFQHGVLNRAHFAYNISKKISSKFYPDYLLTFGEKELKVFENSHYIEKENCFPIGSFYIDYIQQTDRKNIIAEKFPGYKKYIAVVLQDMYDDDLFNFLKLAFKELDEVLFVLIPRDKTADYYRKKFEFHENMVFFDKINTYEIIKMCDIHTTINSTTAIEAASLGTPNILINCRNLSREYYADTLKDLSVNKIAETTEEYIDLVRNFQEIDKSHVVNSNNTIFRTGFTNNLNKILTHIYEDNKK